MASSSIGLLPGMAEAGMNAALPKFDVFSTPFPVSTVVILRKWAEQCQKQHLMFMPVINWWTAEHGRHYANYNHVVTDSGTVLANTPCPYTRGFWDRWITPRFLAMVRAIKGLPLDSVLVDLEMYGAEYTDYSHGCFCDECFSRYLKAKKLSGSLPAFPDRAGIVNNAGDTEFYKSLQREAARTFAVTLRETVQKTHPGFRLGALQLDSDIPLQQGMALGFGTPQTPAFCFTENTYSSGHTSYIASTQKSFSDMGAYVDLIAGIWQSRFPTENIAEQLYHCASDSYGYWIYTMDTFVNPDYHPLAGTLDDGWRSIRRANQELDKSAVEKNYRSGLQIRPFEAPPTPLPWGDFVRYDMFKASAKAPKTQPVARLRGTNWVYFHADEGEQIRFEVEWKRVGRYTEPVRAGLMSPTGAHLGEGTAKPGHTCQLAAVAPMSGIYGIVIMSEDGRNSAEIIKSSHPYAIRISSQSGAEFAHVLPTLFLNVMPDAGTVELQFSTQNSAEAVMGTVSTADGSQLWSGVVDGPTRVFIRNPGSGPLRLGYEKLQGHSFGTVWVKAVKGVLPFAATDPSGLLKRYQ
jgi:hypothetical protein